MNLLNYRFVFLVLAIIMNLRSLHDTGCGAVGSALRSGRRGRRFESDHPDQILNFD